MNGPKNYLPACWDDDERMACLMSAFRKREVNPADYDSKMKFWREMILESCHCLNDPLVSIKGLTTRFRRKGCKTLTLPLVVEDMRKSGLLITLDSFHRASSGWLSWGMDVMVKQPLGWLLDVVSGSSPSTSEDEELLAPQVLEAISDAICDTYWREVDDPAVAGPPPPIPYASLAKMVRDVCPSIRVLDLSLELLQRCGRVSIAFHDSSDKLVKFRCDGINETAEVTEIDKTFVSINKTCSKLETEMAYMEGQINRLDQECRSHIRAGNRNKARSVLRKKKLMEKELEKKDASHNRLSDMMYQMQNSHSQKKVLDALKGGVNAFRQTSLSPDKVDTTMDDLHEALSDHEEIGHAMSHGPSLLPTDEDNNELEAELEALLAADSIGESARDTASASRDNGTVRLPELPSPSRLSPESDLSPVSTPGTSTPLPVGSSSTGPPPLKMRKEASANPEDRIGQLRRQLADAQ